jgi:nucleotide-binding universal stress UspA family protein
MTHAEESKKALEHALSEFPDAEITVIHVINPGYHYGTEGYAGYEHIIQQEERKAEQLFERAREIAANYEVEISTEQLAGHTPSTILKYADEQQSDHIVLGSRGRGGLSRLLLGSVAEAIARRSPIPVTIVR